MAETTAILVPIHLDALVLTSATAVCGPLADFTRLPYNDGARDVNSGTGYLSESVTSDPFAGQSVRLPPGTHLHWALPDALTRARNTPAGSAFPAVPDRWLVVRSLSGDGGPLVQRSWLVESDYLHPPGQGAESGSVAYPIAAEAGRPPFRRLGRAVPLERWQPDPAADRVGELTAAGWGEPLFAAFYPHCRNVFGLHDPDAVVPGARYDVFGWYDDLGRDFTLRLLRDPAATLAGTAGWAVPDGSLAPQRTVCHGRLVLPTGPVAGSTVPADAAARVGVAVGNTGNQALGAYLAHVVAGDAADAATVEDQLAAVLLGSRLDPGDPDLVETFRQAVHEDGFVPASAGTLWSLTRQAPAAATDTAAAQPDATALDRLGHALNALNDAQQAYDQAADEAAGHADQLFADWYRYMLCAYPPVGTGEDYPDIDDVLALIADRTLPELANRIALAGDLTAETPAPGTLARAVRDAAAIVEAALSVVNRGLPADGGFRMQSTEAPRYWEPAEPVVLLAGDALQASVRHGADGQLHPDGLLDCAVLNGLPVPPAGPGDVASLVASVELQPAKVWDPQDWAPLALSWQVDVLPVADPHAPPGRTRGWSPGYLLSTYELVDDEPELRLRPGAADLRAAPAAYAGLSVLTPYARDLHRRRLAGYLLGLVNRDQNLPSPTDDEIGTVLTDPAALTRLRTWYDSWPGKGTATPEPVGSSLTALEHLATTPTMSQSLGGFNAGLLGRRLGFQLEVADPIGFDDYQSFTASVGAYLRGRNRSGPLPANAFLPWRTGALSLRRLRLLDTFGRVLSPEWTEIVTSRQLPAAAGGLVTMPARLAQPARLSFRWLSADLGDRQLTEAATETPICGWLFANHLDESLVVHSTDGRALGALDRDGTWQPAPGPGGVAADAIADEHLRRLVAYLLGKGQAFLSALHGALDSALENIDPGLPDRDPDVALLVGRPMAVVRAAIGFELRGPAAVDQGWNALRADLRRTTRTTGGFPDVTVPVRIGDSRRLGDGLVGYWLESGDGYRDPFYAPLSDPIDDPAIRTHADGEMAIERSLADPPQELTMLIDPRGAVHATCGVLPQKDITIPAQQYTEALRAIEVTFLAGPLLMPYDQVVVPVPDEPGQSWAWLDPGGDPRGTPVAAPAAETSPPAVQQLREGWLRLSRQERTT